MIGVEEQLASSDGRLAEAYRRHSNDLIRFATVVVGPDSANDAVSSAVLRLIGRDLSSVVNLRPYLFAAVANEGRNINRGEARRKKRELKVAGSTPRATNPPEPLPEVRRAIEKLSDRQRAVIYLAYWEDLTESDIAEHLGISAGSVRRHLSRARTNLRRELHHGLA